MAAGTSSKVKLVTEGMRAKTTTWMRKRLRKVRGRVIVSESQPQKRRPTPLNIEMTLTIKAAVMGVTPVNFCASGEATEMSAAPAVTFSVKISQSRRSEERRV